jgi:hypothetical protein
MSYRFKERKNLGQEVRGLQNDEIVPANMT